MGIDTNGRDSGSDGTLANWSRRTVLKLTGAAAGVASLGAGGAIGAGQEDENETESNGSDAEENGTHFTADLIDPVFGYPLAADETDNVDVEPVVELYTEEGSGAYENFPLQPGPEGGSEFGYEFAFDPVGIQVTTDDVVQFHSTTGEHTATAFHEKFSIPQREIPTRIPEGVPGFTSPPIVDGESWLYQFPQTGVYDVFCLPHLSFGMVMRVVVTDPDEAETDIGALEAPSAGELPRNAQLVLDAPELSPENIINEGPIAWSGLTIEVPETLTPAGTTTETTTE